MTSFRSKAFNFLMRNGHLFQGKLHKEVFDFNTSIHGFRERCEKGAARYGNIPKEIKVEKLLLEGIPAEKLVPINAPADKIVLYAHGGGYVSGSCSDHRGFVAKMAKYTGVTCLVYEYRLAPEHPFPAALDDSVTVYKRLLSLGYLPENILIAGESAGGGLTLAILLALKKLNILMPAAAIAISPWTDLSCSGDSYITKNRLSPAPLNSWAVFSKYYVGDDDARNPLISPLFGDWSHLPPLLINSAEDDELYDDGYSFYKKAKQSGVEISFRSGKGMLHCYPLLTPLFPEATQAMNEIADFVKNKLRL